MVGMQRLAARRGPSGGLRSAPAPESIAPMMALPRDHAQQDWRDVVARVDVPVLMLAARNSQYWPCEHAAAAVGGNPHGRAVVVENWGHAANIDRPDELNAILLEFLRGLEGGRSDAIT